MRLNFSKLVIPALFLVQCRVSGGWDLVSVQGGTETNVTDVIVNEFPILGGIDISFIRVGGFFGFIGKGLQIAGQIFGFVHKSREDHRAAEQLETNFRQVFGSLDRNFQAIANTREAIDLMMTKSLAAVAGLGQKLDQSTAQILGELGKIDQKVDRNFAYLLKIFKIASETFTAVETTRYEMHEEFAQVLNFVKSSKIEPVITKLNNFVTYFSSETMRISRLTRDERIATLLDENGFIRYLRESRTPKGESLQTAMFEITDRGFAVPKNTNDSMAFAALSSLYFGVKTQISVMRYLTTVNIYLADDAYRKRDLEKFNVHMENLEADHWAFSDTLVGSTDKKGLISSIIELLKKANTLSFGGAKSVNLTERAESLAQDKIKLQETTLPIIQDVPGKLIGTLKFGKGSQHTPIGNWKNGVKVSYAIQYMDQDLYSKVGEWSDPFHVDGLANPRLRIPAHSTFTRLIFRRFDNEAPQFVGRLERGSHGDFWDIDRDLYDAAMGADETKAEIEVNKLIENGANASTMFDLGKRALHGAALSGNAKLAGMYLLGDPNNVYIQDVNGYTPLHVAAENGWTDFITLMMQYGSDLNAKTKAGSTPLHLAISNGFPKAVQVLLKNQAVNVNAQDIDGATPLHKAVLNGDADVLRLLLADERVNANLVSSGNISPLHLSAAVNTPGIVGELTKMSAIQINALATGNISALHIATMTGNMEVMRDLLSLDATNANGKSVNGWSPLHYALALKRDSSVSELLQAGKIDVNVLADGQISPLHIAAASGPTTWLNVLISRGAAVDLPNEDGFTALHIAAINNNMDGVALLVSKNANVNARTANGSTILHLMANCGNEGIIKYILGTGKSIVSARNNVGETALELAEKKNEAGVASLLKNATLSLDTKLVVAAGKGNLTDVQSAVAGGANINVLTPQKDTPLTKAASSGNLAVVQFLVERGAVVNTRGTAGASTPLHLAAGTGHLDIVKYLVEQGADVKARDTNDFETPLGYACASGHQDVVEFLVGKGSEVNAKTCDGGTPLIIATFKGFLNVAKFLVEHGADVNVKKIDGSTPLSIANATKHADIAAYLTSKGAK